MSSASAKSKGGRPPGSRNVTNKQLCQWLETAGAGTIIEKLMGLVEDTRVPAPVALECLRRLFAFYMGRADAVRNIVQPKASTDG
jgi:hypothetical protein